ncbi:unnamed protein product [Ectocarpus sp. 6 AP-2014]
MPRVLRWAADRVLRVDCSNCLVDKPTTPSQSVRINSAVACTGGVMVDAKPFLSDRLRALDEPGASDNVVFGASDLWLAWTSMERKVVVDVSYRGHSNPLKKIPAKDYSVRYVLSAGETEQTTSKWFTSRYISSMKQAMYVWDFSPVNVSRCIALGLHSACWVPVRIPMDVFVFNTGSYNFHFRDKCTQDIDVLFYGADSPRRRGMFRLLNQIPGCTLVFRYYDLFDQEREDLLRRSKIVLNLHYWPDAALEVHRVEYACSRAKCVISESSSDPMLDLTYKNCVAFARYDDIPTKVKMLLQDQTARCTLQAAAQKRAFRNQFDVRTVQALSSIRASSSCSVSLCSRGCGEPRMSPSSRAIGVCVWSLPVRVWRVEKNIVVITCGNNMPGRKKARVVEVESAESSSSSGEESAQSTQSESSDPETSASDVEEVKPRKNAKVGRDKRNKSAAPASDGEQEEEGDHMTTALMHQYREKMGKFVKKDNMFGTESPLATVLENMHYLFVSAANNDEMMRELKSINREFNIVSRKFIRAILQTDDCRYKYIQSEEVAEKIQNNTPLKRIKGINEFTPEFIIMKTVQTGDVATANLMLQKWEVAPMFAASRHLIAAFYGWDDFLAKSQKVTKTQDLVVHALAGGYKKTLNLVCSGSGAKWVLPDTLQQAGLILPVNADVKSRFKKMLGNSL